MKFRLIPSDQHFYDLFDKAVDNLVACVKGLEGFLADNVDVQASRREVADLEHIGDDILAEVMQRLDASFVTPIDREDVSALISAIDDVVDSVHHIAELIAIVGVPTVKEFGPMMELMSKAANEASAAVHSLRKYDGVRERAKAIDNLESEGDELYRQALAHLFDGTFEPLEVMKNKDVIEAAEEMLDGIEDVGDICESIYVKHS